jgi:hypothetical protein
VCDALACTGLSLSLWRRWVRIGDGVATLACDPVQLGLLLWTCFKFDEPVMQLAVSIKVLASSRRHATALTSTPALLLVLCYFAGAAVDLRHGPVHSDGCHAGIERHVL